MSIFRFLGIEPGDSAPQKASSPEDVASIRRIVQSLDRLDPQQARQIAAFAFVLSRVAGADLDISAEEIRAMEKIVMERMGLAEELAVLVVDIARRQNILFGGTDNFLVTRELKASATAEEKEALLHCLFAVSAADDSISSAEENTIAQIASELGVEHRVMLEIRAVYRDKRAVLKDLPH